MKNFSKKPQITTTGAVSDVDPKDLETFVQSGGTFIKTVIKIIKDLRK